MVNKSSVKKLKKVSFLTNIIAPYRIFLFNKLEELSLNSYFDFDVYFMRETESNRSWKIDKKTMNFQYKLGNGLYFQIKSYFGHFNPILIFDLIKNKEEIILGASWNNLNVLFIALFKSLGLIKNKLSVWSEANYLTNESQKKNKVRDILKKWFFSQIDGNFIVPGKMAILSFEKWNIPYQNIITLPNLVNNETFLNERLYVNDMNEKPVLLIVARLEENIKGIKNFFQAIGFENIMKVNLRIAGSGSSLKDYEDYVQKNGLENNVSFLGNLTEEQISSEYKKASIFILPSFSDPSPLSIIEAIYSGLPVLISNRCGNHFETVENGVNGYVFDPLDQADIKDKFDKLLNDRYKWDQFSIKSREIAKRNFDPTIKLNDFLESYRKYN